MRCSAEALLDPILQPIVFFVMLAVFLAVLINVRVLSHDFVIKTSTILIKSFVFSFSTPLRFLGIFMLIGLCGLVFLVYPFNARLQSQVAYFFLIAKNRSFVDCCGSPCLFQPLIFAV